MMGDYSFQCVIDKVSCQLKNKSRTIRNKSVGFMRVCYRTTSNAIVITYLCMMGHTKALNHCRD